MLKGSQSRKGPCRISHHRHRHGGFDIDPKNRIKTESDTDTGNDGLAATTRCIHSRGQNVEIFRLSRFFHLVVEVAKASVQHPVTFTVIAAGMVVMYGTS